MSKQETPIIGLNESVFFDSIEFELRDGVGDSTVVHQINNLVNNLSLAQSLYSRGQNRYIEYVKSLTKSFRPIAGVREIEFNKLTLNVEDARTLKDQVAPALDSITAGDEKVASWTFVAAGLLNSLENHPQSRSIGQGGRKEDVSAHAREAITQAKSKVIKYLNETWDPDPENNWIDLTARYGKRASPAIPVILAACVAPAMETSIETVTAREGVGAESTATAQALIKFEELNDTVLNRSLEKWKAGEIKLGEDSIIMLAGASEYYYQNPPNQEKLITVSPLISEGKANKNIQYTISKTPVLISDHGAKKTGETFFLTGYDIQKNESITYGLFYDEASSAGNKSELVAFWVDNGELIKTDLRLITNKTDSGFTMILRSKSGEQNLVETPTAANPTPEPTDVPDTFIKLLAEQVMGVSIVQAASEPEAISISTPNLQETQTAISAQETQIAQDATATAQEVSIQATARAEDAKQAQEKEQIDNFYNTAREQLGIEIVKDPELISNNSEVLSFYLSQTLFNKNINSIHFYKEFQDLYGDYLLGRIAGMMDYYYSYPEYADIGEYVEECTMWDLDGSVRYVRIKINELGALPLQGIDIHGRQVTAEINHIEVQFVAKREFDQLLKLAQEQELSFLYRGEFNSKNKYRAMIIFEGTKMITIGYDTGYHIAAEYIPPWASNEDKFIYFQNSINPLFMATMTSLAGDRFIDKRTDPNFTSECDFKVQGASAIIPMRLGHRENSSMCTRVDCNKIAENTFK